MTDTLTQPLFTAWRIRDLYRYAMALECSREQLLARFKPVSVIEYPDDSEEIWTLGNGAKLNILPYEPSDRED